MIKEWYYVENGVKSGPLLTDELKGKISKDSLLWSEGMTDWTMASNIIELKSFFVVTPPPIPDSESLEKNYKKHSSRIFESVLNSWALVILTILTGMLEYVGNDNGRFYFVVVLLSLTTFVRVLFGLKTYLSKLLNYKSANVNIYWLMGTIIPMFVYVACENRYNLETTLSEFNFGLIMMIVLTGMVVYIYHSVRLAIKLFKVEGVAISSFRTYAFLNVVSIAFLSGISLSISDDNYPMLLETLINTAPVVFLALGFQSVRKAYVV